MSTQSLPDISRLANRMASNHAKATAHIDTLVARIDTLVTATAMHDWEEVGKLSEEMAQEGRETGHRNISALAMRLHVEAHKANNEVGVKRSLIRLIGTHSRSAGAKPREYVLRK